MLVENSVGGERLALLAFKVGAPNATAVITPAVQTGANVRSLTGILFLGNVGADSIISEFVGCTDAAGTSPTSVKANTTLAASATVNDDCGNILSLSEAEIGVFLAANPTKTFFAFRVYTGAEAGNTGFACVAMFAGDLRYGGVTRVQTAKILENKK